MLTLEVAPALLQKDWLRDTDGSLRSHSAEGSVRSPSVVLLCCQGRHQSQYVRMGGACSMSNIDAALLSLAGRSGKI